MLFFGGPLCFTGSHFVIVAAILFGVSRENSVKGFFKRSFDWK